MKAVTRRAITVPRPTGTGQKRDLRRRALPLPLNSLNLTPEQKAEIRKQMYATIYEWRRRKAERAEKWWTKRGLCAAGGYLLGRLLVRADKDDAVQLSPEPDGIEEIAKPVVDEFRRQCSGQEKHADRSEAPRRRRHWKHRFSWRDPGGQYRLTRPLQLSPLLPPPTQ